MAIYFTININSFKNHIKDPMTNGSFSLSVMNSRDSYHSFNYFFVLLKISDKRLGILAYSTFPFILSLF